MDVYVKKSDILDQIAEELDDVLWQADATEDEGGVPAAWALYAVRVLEDMRRRVNKTQVFITPWEGPQGRRKK